MSDSFSLKDHLFNEVKVRYLADLLVAATPNFDAEGFVQSVMKELPTLELKARIHCIATVLHEYLPTAYEESLMILVRALPPPLDPTKTDGDFGDFIFAPFGEFVVRQGCTKEYLTLSLAALHEITKRFSMEFAIRPFLTAFPEETIALLKEWVHDENYHVRRLVSEGTRPFLPWGGHIQLPESATVPLLSVLHTDRSRYVTRSVANHLNDLSKVSPELVLQLLASWQKEALQTPVELAWITKHALRTGIKRGEPAVLAFLGYQSPVVDQCELLVQPSHISVTEGGVLELSVRLLVSKSTPVVVDYHINFVKKNAQRRPRVYRMKTATVVAGEVVSLRHRHRLIPNATTVPLYQGVHTVTIFVNGEVGPQDSFTLI